MKFDTETRTLSFSSLEEVDAFHQQLTDLVRATVVDVVKDVADPMEAKRRSAQVMERCSTVMRALNQIRRALPRRA